MHKTSASKKSDAVPVAEAAVSFYESPVQVLTNAAAYLAGSARHYLRKYMMRKDVLVAASSIGIVYLGMRSHTSPFSKTVLRGETVAQWPAHIPPVPRPVHYEGDVPGERVQQRQLPHVIVESLVWGIGTAIGELPPYFIARAG
ncbi:Vacuole membrane protein KMS2 [Smittium culicis]|uniref:Vacuole membrane protein KMS2 n=1 Tax=Smittium culicis TaxID=133412 RepID=A0A1R1YPT1_9FUNG|nr:Vacuole membrane protein KMS2 [Smittium culicis]